MFPSCKTSRVSGRSFITKDALFPLSYVLRIIRQNCDINPNGKKDIPYYLLMMKLCDLKRPNRTVNSFRKVKKMTLISMSTFCMLPALKMTYDPYQRENL